MAYTPTERSNGQPLAANKFNKLENGLKSADSSYVPTEWSAGDVITAEKLNKIENGIADAAETSVTVESLSVNENGTYTAQAGSAYSPVTVAVPTGPAKSSSDLTVSGATVTAPAGLYASAASKSVASGSATTPATTITPNAISISVNSSTGVITASNTQKTQNVTPTVSAGYVSSGTAGTITVSAASKTSNLTTQAAQTIHPSTSDQTIASGKYLTGTQTFKGVVLTNLTAENIKDGVTVKVGDSTDDDCVTSVTGNYTGGGGGGGVTTVTFPNSSVFVGQFICYVDGNGDYQYTTQLASLDSPTYQMLTGSLVVVVSEMGMQIDNPSTLTLVDSKLLYTSTSGGPFPIDYYIICYQVG